MWSLCGLGYVGLGVHAQLITSGRRYAIDIRRVALHHNTGTQVTLRAMTTPSRYCPRVGRSIFTTTYCIVILAPRLLRV